MLDFLKRKKKNDRRSEEERKAEQDARVRNACALTGFVLTALSFMWAQSMHGAYETSRAALEDAYAAKIAAAGKLSPDIDMYGQQSLPWAEAGDVDLDAAVADVAELQNRFVTVTAEGYDNFDVYAEQVQAIWDGMEEWFPNDSAHSWYQWDSSSVAAAWEGFRSNDKAGRPVGVWLCRTSDGTVLAYAMAWYAGDHMFSNWTCGVTPAGYTAMEHEEYSDPLSGTYETAPGDGDMEDGRTLDDHVGSALTILDGLGLSHDWYDSVSDGGQEEGGVSDEAAG